MKTALSRISPQLYKFAVVARSRVRHAAIAPLRAMTRARVAAARAPITIEVGAHSIGLGAILSHGWNALSFGRRHGLDVALRFTGDAYRPSWGSQDWLEDYFVRLGRKPDGRSTFEADVLPHPPDQITDDLLWRNIAIRPEIVTAADHLAGHTPFASIHYRGSDKFLERKRVAAEFVLSTAEREMRRDKLDRIFIASDEPTFVELAQQYFGESAFSLPCEALANSGRPPHLSSVAGEVKAREALTTLCVLARSKLCVRTPSYLSLWATTLAKDQRSIMLALD